jgi:hypothetical protein
MKEIKFAFLHPDVMMVYVLSRAEPELPLGADAFRGDWAAYVVPRKPEESTEETCEAFASRGVKTTEAIANAVAGGICEKLERRGYKYRR